MPSGFGSVTVVSAGTPVALSSTSRKVSGLDIKIKAANTGANMYVKGTQSLTPGATGLPVAKGGYAHFEYADLKEILMDGDSSGDVADFYFRGDIF